MDIWIIGGEVSLVVLIIFFLFFFVYSLWEKEKRACWLSLVFILFLAAVNFLVLIVSPPMRNWGFGIFFVLSTCIFLFLIFSRTPNKSIKIVGMQRKFDERDIIFARFDYEEGSEIFKEYYARKPEYKKLDDEIRALPNILSPGQTAKSPFLLSLAASEFDFLEHQLTQVSGKESHEKIEQSPLENARVIKNIIEYLGSDLCGICGLSQAYVYSHVGRGPEPYGEEIKLDHKYAIAFGLEMEFEWVAAAPKAPVIVETAKKYVEAAKISIIIADFIRRIGYSARAHIAGSNYEAVLSPIAWEAGLGELGRLGILITSKYGPRARLGLITTDMPLNIDQPKVWGIQNFCEKCLKCAKNCPAQAIPYGEICDENGVLKWVLNREKCYRFWRKAGTDCAMCIYVCPYSKQDNLFHNLIRKMASKSSAVQTLSIRGDDLFYGKTPTRRKSPF